MFGSKSGKWFTTTGEELENNISEHQAESNYGIFRNLTLHIVINIF